MTTEPNVGVCEQCFGCIEGLVEALRVGPFVVGTSTRTRCDDCTFREGHRVARLLRCPYQVPVVRPRADGSAPEAFLKFCRDRRQSIKAVEAQGGHGGTGHGTV